MMTDDRMFGEKMVDNVDFDTLFELGLRRLVLSDITLSEREIIGFMKLDDIKRTVEFMQSVIDYKK